MALPTWNKMKQDIKLSAKGRYELIRSEINSLKKGGSMDNSIEKDVASLDKRVSALESKIEALKGE